MSRHVTLAEIAEAAGVSVGTVSKAVNGRGQLAAGTREKVMRIAKDLGFHPSHAARLNATGRSFLVGVLSTDSYGRFTIPILTGAEDTFGAGEVSMLLAESRGDPIREQHYISTFLSHRVDGLIVAGRSSDTRASLSRVLPMPTVYALAPSDDPNDVSIVPDDGAGATRAIEHLIGTGRKTIAVFSGSRRHAASISRAEAACRAIVANGGRVANGEPLYGEWSERWGYEATARLLDTSFDGVFCASDQIARGVVDCLRDNGIVVPTEVAVVGVDNWDVIAGAARPSITSVDLNLREVGRKASELLMRKIAGENVPGGLRYVDCLLITRQST